MSMPIPPPGYRLLKEGDLIPECYIYWDETQGGKWVFNETKEWTGQQVYYNPDKQNSVFMPIAVSIFNTLTDNLSLVAAELKRTLEEGISEFAKLSPEDLGSIILQAILCGDFTKQIVGGQYIPYRHFQAMKEKLVKYEKSYHEQKQALHALNYASQYVPPHVSKNLTTPTISEEQLNEIIKYAKS